MYAGLGQIARSIEHFEQVLTISREESFQATRAIPSAAGIVGRVLRLLDALALADTAGILTAVRAEVAGEKMDP